ncbi:MAG: cob(I)yrinic acid a,c-diamide adenosyltransferase [Chloroflexi bacterium]|nr:cob(I)yrinic acid a,c-diamide adenosyltransferase [Chloroflexota bacterium]
MVAVATTQETPAPAEGPAARQRRRHGLVVINTGNGKGKTTAALGVLFRAWGRGFKVVMLQFIKQTTSNYGENRAARKLSIEMIPLGGGFTWLSKDIERDKALARQAWELCKEKLRSPAYDVVILDEITYPISYGWIPVEEVIAALGERPAHQHVIITGRNASEALIEYADLVTEMREVKHPFQKGIKAQPGLDF